MVLAIGCKQETFCAKTAPKQHAMKVCFFHSQTSITASKIHFAKNHPHVKSVSERRIGELLNENPS